MAAVLNFLSNTGSFLIFILIIALLVFIHELGHFLAAKLSGVKVNEFALGFGPSIFKKQYKGTEYKINIVPLGGYVALEGEEHVNPEQKTPEHNFQHKSLVTKAFILLAGVVMNILLAVVMLAVYLFANGYQVDIAYGSEFNFVGVRDVQTSSAVIVSEVLESSPADGNLESNDVILGVDGESIENQEYFLSILSENAGETVSLTVISQEDVLSERYVDIVLGDEGEDIKLGVKFITIPYQYTVTYPENVLSAVSHTYNLFNYQTKILVDSVKISFADRDLGAATAPLGSLVTVGVVVDSFIDNSQFLELLNLTALVSISLAFFNLIPLSVLDGGQLLIYVIEFVRRKKLNERFVNILNQITFLALIVLSILLIFRDIFRYFT